MKETRGHNARTLSEPRKKSGRLDSLPGICLVLIWWLLFSPGQAFAKGPEQHLNLIAPESVRVLIVSAHHAVLASEISARIKILAVDSGEAFKQGQPLVVMDTSLYQARAQKAAAEYDAAQKSLAIHTKLAELGSVSELEMVATQGRMEAARADLALERNQVNLGTIKAPFDGCVVTRIAHPHEYVTPGQPLIEIIDKSLKLQLHLPSVWLRWLKSGIGFKVAIDETGQTYPAIITRLGGRIDPVSQTIEVWAKITGKYPELLAGMSGVCQFLNQDRPVQ
ncbi:MAG: efflux RND transporter periplasmic adaptor subunit [Desulfobacteraceae bacterium]|nr:efflux RND transporter periplasmic adaptor subunit [Desulfobacteraceae bacterium]